MHNNGNGEKLVSVPAGLVRQLQNMTSKGGNGMQSAPGAPSPTPRPVSPTMDSRAED